MESELPAEIRLKGKTKQKKRKGPWLEGDWSLGRVELKAQLAGVECS